MATYVIVQSLWRGQLRRRRTLADLAREMGFAPVARPGEGVAQKRAFVRAGAAEGHSESALARFLGCDRSSVRHLREYEPMTAEVRREVMRPVIRKAQAARWQARGRA